MPTLSGSNHPRSRPGGRSTRVVSVVLAAAVDVLIDHGYRGFSISEVAQRAGVHETSIYRRWQTKAQLVSEAIIRNAAQGSPPVDTGSFHGDMYALLRTVLSRLQTPLGKATSQVVASQDPDLASLRRAYWNSRLEAVGEIVVRARERGEVPASLDPRFAMEMFTGPMIVRATSGEVVSARYVKKLVDHVVPMLSAP